MRMPNLKNRIAKKEIIMHFKKLCSAVLAGGLAVFLMAGHANAEGVSVDNARAYVEKVANQAISEVAGKEDVSQQEAEVSFRVLLKQAFDMETIARFTLGRHWRMATAQEKTDFKKALEGLIIRSYTQRLKDYNGQGFEVTGGQKLSEKDVGVNMLIYPDASKQNPVDLVWRVRSINGKNKIIDLSVEGVSMSITQRTEFASVIQRNGGTIQVLIDSLNKKEKLE